MGEMADFINEQGRDDMGPPEPEDYLGMADAELKQATAGARTAKLKGIRAWPEPLTAKQRYCLAVWLVDRDLKYA